MAATAIFKVHVQNYHAFFPAVKLPSSIAGLSTYVEDLKVLDNSFRSKGGTILNR